MRGRVFCSWIVPSHAPYTARSSQGCMENDPRGAPGGLGPRSSWTALCQGWWPWHGRFLIIIIIIIILKFFSFNCGLLYSSPSNLKSVNAKKCMRSSSKYSQRSGHQKLSSKFCRIIDNDTNNDFLYNGCYYLIIKVSRRNPTVERLTWK